MLIIHQHKRLLLSTIVVVATTISVLGLVVNKIVRTNSASAVTYDIPTGYTTITDRNFYDCVANAYLGLHPGADISNGLTDGQLTEITQLNCNKNEYTSNENKISDTTGIEKMTGLTRLELVYNHIYNIDLSHNTALNYVDLSQNYITTMNLSQNTAIVEFYAFYNNLTGLVLPNSATLTKLDVNHNAFTSLDVSNATGLTELQIYNNQLDYIDLSHNTALTRLTASSNRFSSIDVSHNTSLVMLNVYNNKLSSIDVSRNTALERLIISNNQLTSIDLSHNTALANLNVSGNQQLTSLDVSHNTNLSELHVYGTQLSYLDVTHNPMLNRLYAENILILSNLDIMSVYPTIKIGLAGLKFLQSSHSVSDTDNYTYDSINKIVTVNNPAGTNGYIQLSSTVGSGTYKLIIPNFLIFDTNGGTGTIETLLCNLEYGSAGCDITLPETVPTRDDYQFLGWADSADATSADYQAGSTISLSTSKSIYAIWSPIYTLDFNLNGGNGTFESQTCYPITTDGDCSINIPSAEPTKEDYHFLGWADSADATSASYAPNAWMTLSVDKTIYAVWAPIYTLSFDLNNGTGTFAPQTCHPNATSGECSINLSNASPSRNGYNFAGWIDTDTPIEIIYAAGSTVTLNGDKTLYASWSKIITTLTLNFDLNGAEGAISDVTCGIDIDNPTCTTNIPNTEPTRNGYTFLGWANASTATAPDYAAGTEVILNSNKTFYAVWEIIYTTLTLGFNLNEGEGTINNVNCNIDINHPTCNVNIPNTEPTRNGYTFLGWANASTATSPDYAAGAEVTLDNNKTLYAIWSKIITTLTLNFNLNGAEGTINSVICNIDIDNPTCIVIIPNIIPTRNGYTFLGWADTNTAEEADDDYVAGAEITLSESKILYAVWEENQVEPEPEEPDDPVNPEPVDPEEPEEPGEDDIVVPDTSVTPDTGINTKTEDNSAAIVLYGLPATIIALAAGLYIRHSRKGHLKFD
ncbi:InlB B-repeat-containing protein [Candidatus Saccharibacteria bacterium]|nr:InlB B-repeat-containing protein [Candidatus Saccharibacteria bacterium]